MPTRNRVKEYVANSYYHIYTRGVNKQLIFHDNADKQYFLSLFQRYLSLTPHKRSKHGPYQSFASDISLLSYCLMDNHIHIFLLQHQNEYAIRDLMRRIMTTYSMYFNKKYRRVGPLFQSRYLASRITNDAYLLHISRYIHRNPSNWRSFPYSSLRYFDGSAEASWIEPKHIIDLLGTRKKYMDFVAEYDERAEQITDIIELAHS